MSPLSIYSRVSYPITLQFRLRKISWETHRPFTGYAVLVDLICINDGVIYSTCKRAYCHIMGLPPEKELSDSLRSEYIKKLSQSYTVPKRMKWFQTASCFRFIFNRGSSSMATKWPEPPRRRLSTGTYRQQNQRPVVAHSSAAIDTRRIPLDNGRLHWPIRWRPGYFVLKNQHLRPAVARAHVYDCGVSLHVHGFKIISDHSDSFV